MLAEKTFIGKRLDLEHFKGLAIVDYELEYLDSDGDAFDLSGYSAIIYELFAKPHGKLLSTEDQTVPSDNVLLLSVPAETFDIRPSYYFYKITAYTDESPAIAVLLSYGVKEII